MCATRPATSTHPIGTDPSQPLAVTLYVRANVTAASRRQIEAVESRLKRLSDTPLIAETGRRQWPLQRSAVEDYDTTAETRNALVTEFERWAAEHGYSLRPAVRRKTVPASMLGPDRPRTEICVPIMMLALEEEGTETGQLRGVVPYTVGYGTPKARTYTVYDWLTAAEDATGVADSRQTSVPTRLSTPADSD